jgi:hypothetical protein
MRMIIRFRYFNTLTAKKGTLNLSMRRKLLLRLALMIILAGSLGCSVGKLLVKVPTPTPEPTKTPRPTFTFTPYLTPTPPPTPTTTFTPMLPTDTPTPQAAETPEQVTTEAEPPTNTPPPPPTNTPVPQPPADTPTLEPPTATPTPQFLFTVTPNIHDTGSAVETRVTAHVIKEIDFSAGAYDSLTGYQVVLVDPLGGEHLSDMSGGKNHSTGEGLGDDHWFNVEVKVSPYTPGTYRAWLVKDGVQQSSEVEFTLAASPFQYVHLDFIWPR